MLSKSNVTFKKLAINEFNYNTYALVLFAKQFIIRVTIMYISIQNHIFCDSNTVL